MKIPSNLDILVVVLSGLAFVLIAYIISDWIANEINAECKQKLRLFEAEKKAL